MSIGIGDSMLQYASSITTSNTGSKIENMSDAALAKAEGLADRRFATKRANITPLTPKQKRFSTAL